MSKRRGNQRCKEHKIKRTHKKYICWWFFEYEKWYSIVEIKRIVCKTRQMFFFLLRFHFTSFPISLNVKTLKCNQKIHLSKLNDELNHAKEAFGQILFICFSLLFSVLLFRLFYCRMFPWTELNAKYFSLTHIKYYIKPISLIIIY